MKIPTKLKIGGHVFKIKQVSLAENIGETSYSNLEIRIDKSAKQSAKEATLFHLI